MDEQPMDEDDLTFVLILETIMFAGVEVTFRKTGGKERFIWTLPDAPDWRSYESQYINSVPEEVLEYCFGSIQNLEDKLDEIDYLDQIEQEDKEDEGDDNDE